MKKFLVNFVFKHYRKEIEDVFIADIFGEVPSKLNENSLKFLLTGGTEFSKWMRISSYSLQRKLQQPVKDGGSTYIGGLIFFKTLDVMMSRLQTGQRLLPVEDSAVEIPRKLEDNLAGVDEFFKRSETK